MGMDEFDGRMDMENNRVMAEGAVGEVEEEARNEKKEFGAKRGFSFSVETALCVCACVTCAWFGLG